MRSFAQLRDHRCDDRLTGVILHCVGVKEPRSPSVGLDIPDNLIDERKSCAPVQVDAENVETVGRERLGRCRPEPAGGSEDECPIQPVFTSY